MAQNSAAAARILTSWTDDLPICRSSGVGSSTNEAFMRNGRRAEIHPMEDRAIRNCREDSKVAIYGVFDGFGGVEVSDFASNKFPAELLLGQLTPESEDRLVSGILSDTFEAIDREYFQSIMSDLVSRMKLIESSAVPSDNPTLVGLNSKTLTGASATVAILLNENRLFIASTGDTRTVVCSMRRDGVIKALTLTVDHVIDWNEDEELRLKHLGVDVGLVKRGGHLGSHGYTRCLGHHRVKGGYQESPVLEVSKDEPVLAFPEHGFLRIEPHHLFMLIYTRSLSDCLADVMQVEKNSPELAGELCRMTLKMFSENTSNSSVAQSVVDKVVRLHHEKLETETDLNYVGALSGEVFQREDITLLVRNFHANLAIPYAHPRSGDETDTGPDLNTITSDESNQVLVRPGPQPVLHQIHPIRGTRSSTTTTESSEFLQPEINRDDPRHKIRPYVDFSHFNSQWDKQPASIKQAIVSILSNPGSVNLFSHQNGDSYI